MNRFALARLPAWLPVAAWMAVIFVASSIPGTAEPGEPGTLFDRYHLDKPTHFLIFGLLSWLWTQFLHRHRRWPLPRALAVGILLAAAYGATDEWHQHFVRGRYCSFGDWQADALGAFLGAAAYYWYDTYRRPKRD